MGVSNLNRWTNKLIFLKSTQHPIIWRQPMYKGRCWIINNESCSGVGGLLVLLVGTIPHAKLITSESSASAETDKSCKIKWFGRLWPTVTSATIFMNTSSYAKLIAQLQCINHPGSHTCWVKAKNYRPKWSMHESWQIGIIWRKCRDPTRSQLVNQHPNWYSACSREQLSYSKIFDESKLKVQPNEASHCEFTFQSV